MTTQTLVACEPTVHTDLSPFKVAEVPDDLPAVLCGGEIQPRRPKELSEVEDRLVSEEVEKWMALAKIDPSSLELPTLISELGTASACESKKHIGLYDALIADIMSEEENGETKGSRRFNLMQLKQAFDSINPVVLAAQPIEIRILFWTWKTTRLPGMQAVLDTVYKRRETVSSTIEGIKMDLLVDAKRLEKQLEEVRVIYEGLKEAYTHLRKEIYFGQKWYAALYGFAQGLTDDLDRRNIEAVLAELMTQINTLLTEENLYMQFFANAQTTARLVREQQMQIRNIVRLLERAVLANLGLRVVSVGLERSVDLTQMLGDTIADTMKDTAGVNERTAKKLRDARKDGIINLDTLQTAIDTIVRTLDDEAKADRLLIEHGAEVGERISEMTDRLSRRIVV